MATDLSDALWGYLAADSTLLGMFGRDSWLWKDEAPPREPIPHGVIIPIEGGDVALNTTDGYSREEDRQINVFAPDRDTAYAMAGRIADMLDPSRGYSPLAYDDGAEVVRYPTSPPQIELDPDLGPDGNDVWAGRVFVTFLVSRVLGG